jgi:predicted ATPase
LLAKVTFILGLCGSGKTYLPEKLKKQTGADVFENLFENGISLSALIQCLKEGKDPPCQSRNHPDSANLIL